MVALVVACTNDSEELSVVGEATVEEGTVEVVDDVERLGDGALAVDLAAVVSSARERGFAFDQSLTISIQDSISAREISSSVPTATGHLVGSDYEVHADLTDFTRNGWEPHSSLEDLELLPDRIELDLWVLGDRVVMDKTDFYQLNFFAFGDSGLPSGAEFFDLSQLSGLSGAEFNNVSGGFFSAHVANPSGLLEVVGSLSDVTSTDRSGDGAVISGSISYGDYVMFLGVYPEELLAVAPIDSQLPAGPIGFEPIGIAGETPVEVIAEVLADGSLERVETIVDVGAYLRAVGDETNSSTLIIEDDFRYIARTVQTFEDLSLIHI